MCVVCMLYVYVMYIKLKYIIRIYVYITSLVKPVKPLSFHRPIEVIKKFAIYRFMLDSVRIIRIRQN